MKKLLGLILTFTTLMLTGGQSYGDPHSSAQFNDQLIGVTKQSYFVVRNKLSLPWAQTEAAEEELLEFSLATSKILFQCKIRFTTGPKESKSFDFEKPENNVELEGDKNCLPYQILRQRKAYRVMRLDNEALEENYKINVTLNNESNVIQVLKNNEKRLVVGKNEILSRIKNIFNKKHGEFNFFQTITMYDDISWCNLSSDFYVPEESSHTPFLSHSFISVVCWEGFREFSGTKFFIPVKLHNPFF